MQPESTDVKLPVPDQPMGEGLKPVSFPSTVTELELDFNKSVQFKNAVKIDVSLDECHNAVYCDPRALGDKHVKYYFGNDLLYREYEPNIFLLLVLLPSSLLFLRILDCLRNGTFSFGIFTGLMFLSRSNNLSSPLTYAREKDLTRIIQNFL